LKINDQSDHWPTYVGNGPRTWAKTCVRRHIPAYATRVSEVWKMNVFYNNE